MNPTKNQGYTQVLRKGKQSCFISGTRNVSSIKRVDLNIT